MKGNNKNDKDQKETALSAFLRRARLNAGMNQTEVALALGYTSPQFISNWERGLARPPVVVLKALAETYRVSAEELLEIFIEDVRLGILDDFAKQSQS